MPTKKQKEARTRTMLRLPNTEEGRALLAQLRRYAIGGTRIRIRGRGPRVALAKASGLGPRGFDQELPIALAAELAVYIEKPTFRQYTNAEANRLRQRSIDAYFAEKARDEAIMQSATLLAKWQSFGGEIDRLESDRKELIHQRDAMQGECQRLRTLMQNLRDEVERLHREARSDNHAQPSQPTIQFIIEKAFFTPGGES